MRWCLVALAPGCLLFVDPQGGLTVDTGSGASESTSDPFAAEDQSCEHRDCQPYRCNDITDSCESYCLDDEDCFGANICAGIDCEPLCREEDCDGFACNDYNACETYCVEQSDCAWGYVCCLLASGCDGAGRNDCYQP